MSSTVHTINVNTPFLLGMPNSRVSPEWIRLLGTLISTTNSGVTSDDTTTIVFTTRRPPDQTGALNELRNSQQFASLRGLIRDLVQRIEALEVQSPKKTASGAMTCEVMDDNATNQTVYPTWTAGKNGQQQRKTSSTQWTFNPSTGQMTAIQIVASTGFGCNGATAQTAYASGGALAAYGAGANGFDTAAHAQALYNLVVNIRAALVACGIMS